MSTLGERVCSLCGVKIATNTCNHMDNDGERVIMRQSDWAEIVNSYHEYRRALFDIGSQVASVMRS